jgi:hypothetical protein
MTELDDGLRSDGADERVSIMRGIGYAGLVPFVLLALWLYGIGVDHPWRAGTISLLLGYGAVILSFLGGVRWGLVLAGRSTMAVRDLWIAALVPLVGWLAVFVPLPYAFALSAVAFAAHGAWDSFAVHSGDVPEWYGKLRMQLTLAVVLSMIVAFAATS